MDCNKPYTITHVSELDIDDLSTTPDYFLGIRTLPDQSTGSTIYTPVRVPGTRVMPTGNLANVTALTTNNTALEVPANQVMAGYIDPQVGGNIMRYAGPGAPAMFLMIGEYTNGKMLIQSTGFLTITAGHSYIVGEEYYLGENGEVTTDSTITGQKLFMPLSDTVLMVNGDF